MHLQREKRRRPSDSPFYRAVLKLQQSVLSSRGHTLQQAEELEHTVVMMLMHLWTFHMQKKLSDQLWQKLQQPEQVVILPKAEKQEILTLLTVLQKQVDEKSFTQSANETMYIHVIQQIKQFYGTSEEITCIVIPSSIPWYADGLFRPEGSYMAFSLQKGET